jgi:hypothetical protein
LRVIVSSYGFRVTSLKILFMNPERAATVQAS